MVGLVFVLNMCKTGYLFLSVLFVPRSCFIPYPSQGVPARPRCDNVAWGQRRSLAAPCWTPDGDGLPGHHDLALSAVAGGEEGAQMPQNASMLDIRNSASPP